MSVQVSLPALGYQLVPGQGLILIAYVLPVRSWPPFRRPTATTRGSEPVIIVLVEVVLAVHSTTIFHTFIVKD